MPLTHRGYSVYIESEGQELPQYNVEVVNERTVTCWIPSEAGRRFIARFRTIERHDHKHITAELHADGRYLSGAGGDDVYEGEMKIDFRRISDTSVQHFIFSEVQLVSDNADVSVRDVPAEIATINLEIRVAQLITYDEPYTDIQAPIVPDDDIRIPERSKLLGINQVKPAAIEPYTGDDSGRIGYLELDDEPYAIFRFKHRPAAVLQAMGIMPRPTLLPSPLVDSASNSTPRKRLSSLENASQKRRRVKEEQLDAKLSADDELEAKRRRIKAKIAAERAEAAAHVAKAVALEAELEEIDIAARSGRTSVKAERAPSPIRLSQSGETVDLTDD